MNKFWFTAGAAVLLAPAAWAPASAQPSTQPQSQPQQQNPKPAHDPNEIVCERQKETGSRLAMTKVCKTRAQWAEDQRGDRMMIEKMQTQRDLNPGH